MAKDPASSDAAVGPGRPPRHAQFRKGQSGNPRGRPPKERDLKKLVERELDAVIQITDQGKKVKLTKREVLARKLVNDALMGEAKAIQSLIKLSGGAPEVEPIAHIDPEELARFLRRYSPRDDEGDAE